jgi:hypothetical protein
LALGKIARRFRISTSGLNLTFKPHASAVKMGIVSIVDLPGLCHDRAGEVRTNL